MENQKSQTRVSDLSLAFALKIISFVEVLEAQRKYVIAKQLLRSATSIGANINEAQNPESRADFIHKLKLAAKEAEETKYWLTLCNRSESYPSNQNLFDECIVINKVLSKIIGTTKSNA